MAKIKPADKKIRQSYPDGMLVGIYVIGRELQAIAEDGTDLTDQIRRWIRKKASDAECGLMLRHTKTGGIQWRQVPMSEIGHKIHRNGKSTSAATPQTVATPAVAVSATPLETNTVNPDDHTWTPFTQEQVLDILDHSSDFQPTELVIDPIRWKYLMRSALRGKNILMVGPAGCGKTMAARSVARAFPERPFFYFNMGATQDPRGALIGNTHFNREEGTFVADALFVQAIRTPGSIILLDELSRAHDDAANILMTVLDEGQRYLRIDERPDTPTVAVAPGVVFIATANIGNEYTGTRVMDRALLDRFIMVEMEPMAAEKELDLLKSMYPDVDEKSLKAITEIAENTRVDAKTDDPKVSTQISTRMCVEMAGCVHDGFTLSEAAEVCIYPFYSNAGGADSERTYMKQLVQKFLPTEFDGKEKPWNDGEKKSPDTSNKIPW